MVLSQISSSLVEEGVAGSQKVAAQDSNLRLAAAWQVKSMLTYMYLCIYGSKFQQIFLTGQNVNGRQFKISVGEAKMSSPRIELGTFRVLGECHNQLDHEDVVPANFL